VGWTAVFKGIHKKHAHLIAIRQQVRYLYWLIDSVFNAPDSLISLNVNDLEDGRLIWGVLVGSVNADDLSARPAQVSFLGSRDGHVDQIVSSLVRWNLESNDATCTVQLSDD
jgi:hypothetical protein